MLLFTQGMYFVLLFLLSGRCLFVNTLFEDQVGVLDWSQTLIGNVEYIAKSPNYPQRYFVGSTRNVIAALHRSNGSIAWRRVLHDEGQLLNLLVCGQVILTLSLENTFVLRSWDAKSGALKWDKQFETNSVARANMWCLKDYDALALASNRGITVCSSSSGKDIWKSHDFEWSNEPALEFELTTLVKRPPDQFPHTWVLMSRRSTSLQLSAIHKLTLPSTDLKSFTLDQVHAPLLTSRLQDGLKSCAVFQASGAPYLSLVCLTYASANSQLNLLPLQTDGGHWTAVQLTQSYSHIQVLDQSRLLLTSLAAGQASVWNVSAGDQLVEQYTLSKAMFTSVADFNNRQYIFTGSHNTNEPFKNFVLSIVDSSSGQVGSVLSPKSEWTVPKHHGAVKSIHGIMFTDPEKGRPGFELFLQTEDQTVQLLQSDGIALWVRSEALADIKAVEMVDLPVSESQARMEQEFGHTHNNIIEMFVKRFRTQATQLLNSIRTGLVQLIHFNLYLGVSDKVAHQSAKRGKDDMTQLNTVSIPPRLDGLGGENQTLDDFLRRDNFNVHKLIVVATGVGKLFGLESEHGRVVWEHLVPSTALLANGKLLLVQQRNTAHFPLPPVMTLVSRDRETGLPVLFSFNPITGVPLQRSESNISSTDILQAVLYPGPVGEECDHLRPILLLHHDLEVTVHPNTFLTTLTRDGTTPLYVYTVDTDSARLVGYKLVSTSGGRFTAQRAWRMELGVSELDGSMKLNASTLHKIIAFGSRPATEHIHSVGRVLGDRSVLYKYLNPNLIAVLTLGGDVGAQTNSVILYLIDVVVGRIVHSAVHRRCSEPVTLVISENWVVYSYYNQKSLRNEVTVLELYEPTNRLPDGENELCASFSVLKPTQLFVRNLVPATWLSSIWPDWSLDDPKWNSRNVSHPGPRTLTSGGSRSIFSSLFRVTGADGNCDSTDQVSIIPEVLHQSYILTTPPVSGVAAVSATERGITSKSIIYGLQRGALIELPKAFFDPRRSLDMTPELSEEGIHPYTPVLVLPDQAVISYNQSLMGLRAIRTATTGLESTSLVFAYGLDIFFTRIAPSLTYDLLKEDFDYTAIATVTLGMLVASVVTQRLATRRAVHRAWA